MQLKLQFTKIYIPQLTIIPRRQKNGHDFPVQLKFIQTK